MATDPRHRPAPRPDAKILRWTCAGCGWQIDVQMPGYPGSTLRNEQRRSGHWHNVNGETGRWVCDGPLTARIKGDNDLELPNARA